MKHSLALAIAAGLALAALLFATHDMDAILRLLAGAGWSILLVIALHLPQTFFSGLGFGVLLPGGGGAGRMFLLRWIRESVNALLPVAQVGGDLVRARLVGRGSGRDGGIGMKRGAAAGMVDLSMEMVAQIIFTLLGVGLLVAGPHARDSLSLALGVAMGMAAIGGLFLLVQALGLFRLIESLVARWTSDGKWSFMGRIEGLHDAVLSLYRQPRRLLSCGLLHLVSWLLGGLETWMALNVLGVDAGLREALIIESLGQAVRGFAFLIPGALGIQEGGYLLVCGMLGIGPQDALALSLVRRLRELALGIPGLVLWHRMERAPPGGFAEGARP